MLFLVGGFFVCFRWKNICSLAISFWKETWFACSSNVTHSLKWKITSVLFFSNMNNFSNQKYWNQNFANCPSLSNFPLLYLFVMVQYPVYMTGWKERKSLEHLSLCGTLKLLHVTVTPGLTSRWSLQKATGTFCIVTEQDQKGNLLAPKGNTPVSLGVFCLVVWLFIWFFFLLVNGFCY